MPEELTDAGGELIWQARYKVWGNAVTEEWIARRRNQPMPAWGEVQATVPTRAHVPRPQNLRFQGQYLDRETGLHYNTFRFYDPDIGRFINPDPIGLNGGHNLYRYTPSPITWIDPWGWAGCTLAKAKAKNYDYTLRLRRSEYPQTFGHISDAIGNGHADIVTVQRGSAKLNRKLSLSGVKTKTGMDRDEWPMAMFKEGGNGASVRYIDPSDNRGAGSSIGNALSDLPDGTRVKVETYDE